MLVVALVICLFWPFVLFPLFLFFEFSLLSFAPAAGEAAFATPLPDRSIPERSAGRGL